MVDRASWTGDVCGVALGKSERTICIEVWTALHAVATAESFEWIVEVDVGIVGSTRSAVAADSLAVADGFVDVVGIAVGVCVDGAIDHAYDVQQEQQAAEYISTLSVVLI
jgi:hypothetical protein